MGLLVGADDVGGGGPRVAGRLAADRGPELRRASDPGLRDLALLPLGLWRLGARWIAQVGSQDLYALGLALVAIWLIFPLDVSVAAHRLPSFSILAPECSLPEQPAGCHMAQDRIGHGLPDVVIGARPTAT